LKDSERYILTTGKASVMRDVLAFLHARAESEGETIPRTLPGPEEFAKAGFDRMILELRRPKSPWVGDSPTVKNLRSSRLGRVLVVTGDAASPEILREIDALRRPRLIPAHLASGLVSPVRTLIHSLRPAAQN